MFRPRVIPILLLQNKGLVKSIKFKNHRYIGDPINAVKILNDLKADELVFFDIDATRENRTIDIDLVKGIGEEANMPFSVGGGITNLDQIRQIIGAGAEKVVINTAASDNQFIKDAAQAFGSSTIVICIDVMKNLWGKHRVVTTSGKKKQPIDPIEMARLMSSLGAGELIIQSVDKDGTMDGYDLEIIQQIAETVNIPVVAAGGAGGLIDIKRAILQGKASAAAAGSIFVYHGPRKGILISYPSRQELSSLFTSI